MTDRSPFHSTVVRAELAVSGYVRNNSHIPIPKDIEEYFSYYFGFFYVSSDRDPSNVITPTDIMKADVFKAKGNILFKQQKYASALKKYTKALSFNINDGKIRCNRSLCYLKLNQSDKALNDSFRAILNEPFSYKSWLRMAQSFESMKQYQECLNIIKHAIKICETNKDNLNKKLLNKYCASIENKLDSEASANNKNSSKKQVISHMFDKDREEWKFCVNGIFDESKMSDDELLDSLPFKIKEYSKNIIPPKLRWQYQRATDIFERRAAKSEFNRWLNRKWIKKVNLFERINHCKWILRFEELVCRGFIPRKLTEEWSVTWSAIENLYLNKRCFMVTIHRISKPVQWLYAEDTYCVPTAKFMIQCLKKAMWSPSDAITQWAIMYKKNGCNNSDTISYAARPGRIYIDWRARNEFHEIFTEMMRFGVLCELNPLENSIEASKKWNTNPYGWNYLDLKPSYSYDIESESSSGVQLMQMDVMRYANSS